MLLPASAATFGVFAAVATAAAQGLDVSSLLPIGGYLTPAVVLVMIIRGDLGSGREIRRLQKENDAKDAIIAKQADDYHQLSDSIIEKMVPVITDGSAVIREAQRRRGRDA